MTEKRIHDLPLKAKPDATDELEIQETADGSSRKITPAGLLAAGLPVTAPTVFVGTSSASQQGVSRAAKAR
jgi:hypothetical protein